MKPYRSLLGLGALALLVVAVEPADAAWNNVFQVTCHRRPRTANYVAAPVIASSAPGCCNPCPPVCTTQCTRQRLLLSTGHRHANENVYGTGDHLSHQLLL